MSQKTTTRVTVKVAGEPHVSLVMTEDKQP